jgi:hypothetical protein
MKKFIITFGSGQLDEFSVAPTSVSLVVESETENGAREKVFNTQGIGGRFCTSYPYEDFAEEFKVKYNMKEYTLEDLEKLRYKR